jgi:serine/threonine protein kinase
MPFLLHPGQCLTTDARRELLVREWRGEGSYARLYRAVMRDGRRGTEADCALKLAKAEVPGALANLAREREALARGRWENVVELLDWGTAGAPFLVLSWIEGQPLREVVERRRQLPLVSAIAIGRDAAAALAALHEAGVAHADLRPDNLLVLPGERRACLTDLGSAVLRPDPRFPEACRQDLRALGALLHLMLTGSLPAGSPPRLARAAGYNREAVALFESTLNSTADASGFLRRADTLLESLGAFGGVRGRVR